MLIHPVGGRQQTEVELCYESIYQNYVIGFFFSDEDVFNFMILKRFKVII